MRSGGWREMEVRALGRDLDAEERERVLGSHDTVHGRGIVSIVSLILGGAIALAIVLWIVLALLH